MLLLFLLSLLIVMIFLIAQKDYMMLDKTLYININILVAVVIDFFIYFISLVLVLFLAAMIILLIHIPIYYYLLEIFILLILSSNVFFTSPGYRIFKLFLPRYKVPILLNNAFYISIFTVVIKENNIILGVIAGLYVSLDSLCILIKRRPLICWVFKINIYHIEKK
jgi:hypothetical protein